MHWPVAGNDGDKVDPPLKDTWQRMEKQFEAGKAKVTAYSFQSLTTRVMRQL